MIKKIPKGFQGILWSRKLDSLDFQQDKSYIIHQILAYGDLGQIKWLFQIYPKKEIVQVFLSDSKKVYTPQAFNFVKNYLLPLKNRKIDASIYVKAVS